MSYRCRCGYDGSKGWVTARTTRDFVLASYDPEEGWDLLGELDVSFPHHRFAGGGDAELNPSYHLSCPACGEDLHESDLWPVEDP